VWFRRSLFAKSDVFNRTVPCARFAAGLLTFVQSGAGVTLVSGSFVGMKIDGLCFRPLQTDDPGPCVAAAFRKGDLPGVVAQFLRAARAAVSP